jgi:hypothetical protein
MLGVIDEKPASYEAGFFVEENPLLQEMPKEKQEMYSFRVLCVIKLVPEIVLK